MLDILKTFVLPYFNFIVFVAIVIYFGRKPIKNMFINRFDKFSSDAKSIRAQFETVQKENSELKNRLIGLDKEIDKLKLQSEQTLKSELLAMEANTKKLIEHIHEETKRITQSEVNEGLNLLKGELIRAAVMALEKKVKEDLNDSLQTKLTEDAIRQLGQATSELSNEPSLNGAKEGVQAKNKIDAAKSQSNASR